MAKLSQKQKIGQFIAQLREQRDFTQEELAEILDTSQSSIARMEKGEQNFTTDMLSKISKALNHKILTLADDSIDFQIRGGGELTGTIRTNTSKNGAMGLLCASLLNKGMTILHGIPRIEEVNRILEVMESIGVAVEWIAERSLKIIPPKEFDLSGMNQKSAGKTRTIIMFMGPLIHRLKEFSLPHSSGCNLGKRSVSAHIYGLEKLGVKIKVTKDSYQVTAKELHPANIIMFEAGDTPTENLLLAAAKILGKTVIKFASANYMVQDVCFFLQKLGVVIEGIGTNTLIVHGVSDVDMDIEHHNSEDPIESMMFLSAAITTNSKITVEACPIDFLELEILKLEKMGFKYKISKSYLSANGLTRLVDITTLPSILKAVDEKITCGAFPDLNIDNLPFFVPIATQSKGTTLIHDWAYEDRGISFLEFRRLGADLRLADPHRVYIQGTTKLTPAQIVAPTIIRSAMIVLIGMMAADGTSTLRNVYSIRRGYEDIANRLNTLGAKIKVLDEI